MISKRYGSILYLVRMYLPQHLPDRRSFSRTNVLSVFCCIGSQSKTITFMPFLFDSRAISILTLLIPECEKSHIISRLSKSYSFHDLCPVPFNSFKEYKLMHYRPCDPCKESKRQFNHWMETNKSPPILGYISSMGSVGMAKIGGAVCTHRLHSMVLGHMS